ncbi:acetoacetate-CoA ligase [Verruconis gallopava]|uniref:Acetoacetate-CoA ligase n=1 Tax=Verruconis gallopava TaxID=253628 RepID=A0A0D2AB72_9PEZI|nr:acetoacetate-CoA ligase [Verruconis gallopava]KIW03845.1 acetoacetate-CoA ligase [Verruconis gallopava]
MALGSASNGIGAPQTQKLWEHNDPRSTPMYAFMQDVNKKYGLHLSTYDELYRWSVDNIGKFWGEVWSFTGVRASKPFDKVVDEAAPMFPRPSWFSGARLNFAENLLFPAASVADSDLAVIAATETSREIVTWRELRDRVRDCQAAMMAVGVRENDRVAGYVANHTNALVAMLATTALGAIWTAVSPDTGVHAVYERLEQIAPVLLFTDNASFYNGKAHPVLPKVAELCAKLPSLAAVTVFQTVPQASLDLSDVRTACKNVYSYEQFVALCTWEPKLQFSQLPPDHPVYILYSSGTTGAPKCIVHGAIGTLIQHKKEHALHCSIKPGSRLFYFTTCTWMMWHWLVSGLASGATLVLYDGSPFRYRDSAGQSMADDMAMPRLIEEYGITHFGTSAKYLSVLEQKNVTPRSTLSLKTLEAIYSTGSPLAPSTFQYVYRAFPPTLNLGSITGGTDIISLFGAPSPLSPVYVGEIQKPGLGMAIQAWSPEGKNITMTGEEGDLVCVKPFPSQPVTFWGATGETKYRASYFEHFEGVWHHGDFVRFNPATLGLVMLGRSDGVLKPQGVRFGSAEIYNVVLKHFPEDVADALCVGRRRETDTDETVVLFLKMEDGKRFDAELVDKVKATVRKELSARHVPGIVDACPEIPVTSNGKKVETAVKQILCGLKVKTGASVSNAHCLDWYKEWAAAH